jgi:hypothetical protein
VKLQTGNPLNIGNPKMEGRTNKPPRITITVPRKKYLIWFLLIPVALLYVLYS